MRERGQATVEYALLLILVSVVVIGTTLAAGDSLVGLYQDVGDMVHEALESVIQD